MLNSNGYSYKTELTGKIDIIGYIFTEIEIDIHILYFVFRVESVMR